MRRRLLNLVAWVSLGLFAATTAVWCRGHFVTDDIYYRGGGPLVSFDSRRGELSLVAQHRHHWALQGFQYRGSEPHGYPVRAQLRRPRDTGEWELAGFALLSSVDAGHWVVTVPCWFVAVVTAAWPSLRFGARCLRGRRERIRGHPQ
jgi:hypothetical protein